MDRVCSGLAAAKSQTAIPKRVSNRKNVRVMTSKKQVRRSKPANERAKLRQLQGHPSESAGIPGDAGGPTGSERLWWWVAVNGASCSTSPFALPASLHVSPRPELILGFSTRAEQLSAQKTILTAPISDARRFVSRTIPQRARKGEVIVVEPDHPDPPTHGPTCWSLEPTICAQN